MALVPNSLSLISVAAIIDGTLKLTVDNTEKKKRKEKKKDHPINCQFQSFLARRPEQQFGSFSCQNYMKQNWQSNCA